jgi:YidC/Oxa1 family membrane protein insertase
MFAVTVVDAACRAAAAVVAALYDLFPSYGFAIAGVTALVTVLSWPLTAHAARCARRIAALQPEVTRLRQRHRDDPFALHVELRALYRERGVSPAASVLPLLAQAPLFVVLLRVVRGLTRRVPGVHGFVPQFLSPSTLLHRHLAGASTMGFLGLDLAAPGSAALAAGGPALATFVALVAVAVAGAYVQQRLAARRRPGAVAPSGPLAYLAVLGPASVAVCGIAMPAAITLYAAVSAWVRAAQTALAAA